jgi:hypothetical protein
MKKLGMAALLMNLIVLTTAQTRSSRSPIQLRAVVAASVKMDAGTPTLSEGGAGAIARSTAENRILITLTTKGQTPSLSARIPVKVRTNARSYLLRVASITGTDSGTIRVEPRPSVNSREHSLNVNRVFALASESAEASGEEDLIDVNLPSSDGDGVREVRIEVEAVPM